MSDCLSLPEGWRSVRFGDVVRQVKDRVDPETAGLERYVAGEHMVTDDLRIRRWGTVGDGYLGPAFQMRFRAGQVLYGSRRTYLRKVAVADFEGVCANTTFVIEPATDQLLPEFLPIVMNSEAFHEHSIEQSKGSVNPYINFKDLTWYEFALPPIPYQRQAVRLLDDATSVVGAYEQVIDALCDQTEALAHAVANEAREAGLMTAIVDLVEPDRPVTYGILKPGTGYLGGVPVIKVKDFPNGRIEEDELLLTSPELDEEFKRSRLRSRDLLISIRGTVGRVAEVPPSLEGANITQDTARLTIRSVHHPSYIRHMLVTKDVQQQITARITGLAVQGINIGALRQVMVPTPTLTRQEELAQEFEIIDVAVKHAHQAAASARDVKSGLRENLVGGGA
jgi:type I restriction enzyme S subunit